MPCLLQWQKVQCFTSPDTTKEVILHDCLSIMPNLNDPVILKFLIYWILNLFYFFLCQGRNLKPPNFNVITWYLNNSSILQQLIVIFSEKLLKINIILQNFIGNHYSLFFFKISNNVSSLILDTPRIIVFYNFICHSFLIQKYCRINLLEHLL